jgi:hypothetical protein
MAHILVVWVMWPWWWVGGNISEENSVSIFREMEAVLFLWALQSMMKLVSFMIACHWSWFCDFRLQFLIPIVFRSSSAESSHLSAGLPTRRVPSGLCRVNFIEAVHYILDYVVLITQKTTMWMAFHRIWRHTVILVERMFVTFSPISSDMYLSCAKCFFDNSKVFKFSS